MTTNVSNDEISSAVAAATSETSGETTAAATETPATETAPGTETTDAPGTEKTADDKVVAKEPEEDEEFYNPTAEELDIIEKSPELKKAYKALRRGFTAKTSDLAKRRKEYDEKEKTLAEKAAMADWVQANPEKAAKALAEATGMTLSAARAEVAAASAAGDDLEAEWAKAVGPQAAKILRPLIDKTVNATIAREVSPVREETARLSQAAARRGIAAAVAQFGAEVSGRGDTWDDDVQGEMAKVIGKIEPGKDTSIEEFLDDVYATVMYRRTKLSSAKAKVERLKKLREEQEPVNSARTTATDDPDKITSEMSDNDAVAAAVRAAKRASATR